MNRPPARAGLPGVDPLVTAQEAEQAAFDVLAAADQAEDATVAARRSPTSTMSAFGRWPGPGERVVHMRPTAPVPAR